jgi:hypothetical protein
MADLTTILKEMAEYVQGTHKVIVDRTFGTVDIIDRETSKSDFFLIGDDADDFISKATDNYNGANITWTDACYSVAKPYVDCI